MNADPLAPGSNVLYLRGTTITVFYCEQLQSPCHCVPTWKVVAVIADMAQSLDDAGLKRRVCVAQQSAGVGKACRPP